jgi:type II secretory pathway component PulJ
MKAILRRDKGFSLMEATISMGLMAMALWLVASILGEYSRIDRFSRSHDRLAEVASQVFSRIRSDAQMAYQISAPLVGSTGTQLQLTRLKPRANRFAPVLPPRTWNPHHPADSITVRYFVHGKVLQRDSSVRDQESLVSEVEEFQCERLGSGGLEIQIQLGGDRARRLKTRIHLPMGTRA